jgi:hypothetical protein
VGTAQEPFGVPVDLLRRIAEPRLYPHRVEACAVVCPVLRIGHVIQLDPLWVKSREVAGVQGGKCQDHSLQLLRALEQSLVRLGEARETPLAARLVFTSDQDALKSGEREQLVVGVQEAVPPASWLLPVTLELQVPLKLRFRTWAWC